MTTEIIQRTNKHKYFRITRIEKNNLQTIFTVQACDSWVDVLFSNWTSYTKENRTIDEAIEHLNDIHFIAGVKEEKVVYKKHF